VNLVDAFAEHLGLDVDVLHARDDVVGVVVDGNVVGSDRIQQLDVVLGRDPVLQSHHDTIALRVARNFLHHRDEAIDLRLVRHVDVAVAEDRQQDVVGAEIVRDLYCLDQQDRERRIGVHREP
jgi:hypothetical protein